MNVEERELYCKGGFCPTLIGDVLDDGRYRIVHKLGFGGFATVWLARDLRDNKYVALKVLTASESANGRELAILEYIQSTESDQPGKTYIAQMLGHFDILSPNGTHLCLVFEVLGPSIGSLRGADSVRHMKLRPDVTRELARQCREALAYLHECGVICVDLNATNILLKLAAIDHLSPQEIYDTFGTPHGQPMKLSHSKDPVSSAAPKFIYGSISFSQVSTHLLSSNMKFVDFGHMMRETSPLHSDDIGFNAPYAAPELIIMREPSKEADVWALACILFEMRAGRQLFQGFFRSEEEILVSMQDILGDLPELWKRQWETLQTQDMNDGADQMETSISGGKANTQNQTVGSSQDTPLAHTLCASDQPQPGHFRKLLNLITSVFPGRLRSWPFASANQTEEHQKDTEITKCCAGSSLHQVVQDMGTWPKYLCRSPSSRKSLILRTSQTPDEGGPLLDLDWVDCLKPPPKGLTIEEAEDFESLLSGMLIYDPEERIGLDKIGGHQWFSKSYPVAAEDDWLERWF